MARVGLEPETAFNTFGVQIDVPQVRLTLEELEAVSPDLADLFEADPYAMSTTYLGLLSRLTKDLEIGVGDIYIPLPIEVFLEDVSRTISSSIVLWSLASIALLLSLAVLPLTYFVLSLLGIYTTYAFLLEALRWTLRRWAKRRFYAFLSYAVPTAIMVFLILTPDPVVGSLYFILLLPLGLIYTVLLVIKRFKKKS